MSQQHETHNKRLKLLRAAIADAGLHGWIIGREDMYQGEEVPAGDERLAYLSGFTGSAGFAVVLADRAGLFSDGRYSLQMAAQTDPAIWQCCTLPDTTFEDWLKTVTLPEAAVIGVDGRLITVSLFRRMERAVLAAGANLVCHGENLLDPLWPDQPAMPPAASWQMPVELAGRAVADKINDLAAQLNAKDCDAVLLTRVDTVNWLVNMRGADLPCTPVNLCFAFYHRQAGLCLFGDSARLTPVIGSDISVAPLGELPERLGKLGEGRLMIDPDSLPRMLFDQIVVSGVKTLETDCPLTATKACKTPAELDGFRAAHRRDGVAMVEFLCWLDQAVAASPATYSETEIAARLRAFRHQQDAFLAPSFDTIAGSGPNGAIVHYRAIAGADRRLAADDVLLLDSGAHYRDGTTDITRTIAIGNPPVGAVSAYSHVLRSHIHLAMAKFPVGTIGSQLDAIARAPLWSAQLDFAHGTGHGVGHVLSVHEGPASISKRGKVALEPGMVMSNEPGYYKTGDWGIRIENLVVVTASSAAQFLEFETITLCPLDRRLIDKSLLSAPEIAWVDAYHRDVYAQLHPALSSAAETWLAAACRPL
ncbi:MAG: aminopeptidase P family protein [Candidatus Puniceispirillaceae bacterium]